jgi:threonine/homoserine/homoserine lactone efflux protein
MLTVGGDVDPKAWPFPRTSARTAASVGRMAELAAFLGVSAVVIMTPGQDTALTIRNTLLGGRRAGVFTAVGVISGQLTWALATSAGLSALLLASESAFLALKLAGAVYLVYLGGRALVAAVRSRDSHAGAVDAGDCTTRLRRAVAYRQGVISNLGNPKVAVFFTSLLPQFVGDDASFVALFSLGVVFAAMTLVWLSAYASLVAKAGDLLRRPNVRRAVEGLMGSVLVGLGVRLATEAR